MALSQALRVAGVILIVGGIAMWVRSSRTDSRAPLEAKQILDSLGTEEKETAQDATALLRLSKARRAVRSEFLRQALRDEQGANKLRLHESGIAIALSRTDFVETTAFYRAVLLPVLEHPAGPEVLSQGLRFMSRWSLVSEMSPQDASSIAAAMMGRIANERRPELRGPMASAIELAAPRLTPEDAATIAPQLFQSASEGDSSLIYDPLRALNAVVPRLSQEQKGKLATAIAVRLPAEQNGPRLSALASTLTPLAGALNAQTSADLAQPLVKRITEEWNPGSIEALASALRSIAPQINPADAARVSEGLSQHVKLEPDASLLIPLTQALAAFGDRLPRATYEAAAASLVSRIKAEHDAARLSDFALSLGVLKDKASPDQFEEAASQIVSRFATERDMQALAALAESIDSVADDLEPAAAQRLSSLLVARMADEHRAGPLLYVATGLESIADEAQGTDAAGLVDHLTARMKHEESSTVLRALAFSAAAFTKTGANFNPAAEALVSRMAEQNRPEALRELTSGLYALREKADRRFFDQAAGILAARIQVQIEPREIPILAASLHALSKQAGPEPFEQAASAMVANVNHLAELEPSLRRLSPKLRPEKAAELAAILVRRIAKEQDPDALRVLGLALADLPEISPGADLRTVLTIPQAPCDASHSPGELFNPLCSAASWDRLADRALHLTAHDPVDDIEPDFSQLVPDDDDADTSSEAGPALDFHRLSDAVSEIRPRSDPSGGSHASFPGIGIAFVGVLLLALPRRWVQPRQVQPAA